MPSSLRDIPPPPGSSPGSHRSNAFFYRLAELQMRRPWTLLVLAALIVAGSLWLAFRLEIKPGFEALLPESRPSVIELERVKERTTGVSTIMVVLEGDDKDGLRNAGDAVVAEVAKVGRPWVGSVECGVHEALAFLEPRAGLFADLAKLKKLHEDVNARYEWEVGKETGATLELDDYEPPEINLDTLKKDFGLDEEEADRFPGGYYQSADGKTLVVAIRSGVLGTDYEAGNEAIRRVREAVDRVGVSSFHPSIRYELSGDLVTSIAEFNAVGEDLTEVGLLGSILIITVVFLYYLRMRTLLAMVLTISIGVSLSFGFTELAVGHLTMATGFLFSIIAGNGINTGIMFMARFLEARRKGVDVRGAIRLAHRDTWLPTLTAACAAAAAYASLVVTEFRGFFDFGVIGGVGMLLCWICTLAFMPSILILAERVSPIDSARSGLFGLLPKVSAGGTRFGVPFAALVERAPRLVAVAGAGLTAAAVLVTVLWVRADPMEYDLTNLRTDMSHRQEQIRLTRLGEAITGFVGFDGMAVLVDRPEQVPLLVEALEVKRDAAPEGEKPFRDTHTLQDFVPADQAAKIPLLLDIKDVVVRAHRRHFVEEKDWDKLERFLPPDDVKPFGIAELPEGMARAFTEADGTRGRIVYISPTDTKLVDDAHYLFRWADSYRRTELADGSVVLGSGRAVIYADIWEAILDDVPKAVAASLCLTLLVVALAFRKGFASAAVMVSLVAGVAWMTALLGVFGVRLNFLNFIALPITFGIGVDYAVNVMQRYRREGAGGALTAVRETGGAVVLCSLTTTVGYLALVRSMNYAVRSLGVAAVLGEVACLLAAVIVLPAVLMWRDGLVQSRARGGSARALKGS